MKNSWSYSKSIT